MTGARHADALRRGRAAAVPPAEAALVLAFYTLATALVFARWLPHLSTALIGPPEDNMQDFWSTYYASVAAAPDQFFFTNFIRYPEGTSLYYHTLSLPKTFAIGLLARMVGTELPTLTLLHNLALLLSFPLSGLGAFALVRYATGSSIGAAVGGFVFAFSPHHVVHTLHHLSVSSLELIPFFAWAYWRAYAGQSVRWLAVAIGCYAVTGLFIPYFLFYLAYFVVFHSAFDWYWTRRAPAGWRLAAPLACLAGTALVLSPVLVPMVLEALQNPRVYAPGHNQVADLAAYVAFPYTHPLAPAGEWAYSRVTANPWEATAYLGLVNLVLIAWLLLRARPSHPALVTYATAGMVVFAALASGAYLFVRGRPTIPMPDMLLSALPFFSNVRGPSRALVMVYLFLALLVGQAVAAMWDRRRAGGRALVGLIAALVVVDFIPMRALEMTPVACPPALAVIRDDSDAAFGVLNLPSGRPAAYLEGNYYMFQQACHGRPIVQGTTSRDVTTSLRDHLQTTNFDAQRRQLTEARVKYIVITHPQGRVFRWRAEDGPQEQYAATYPLVYGGPDLSIFRVY